MSLNCSIGWHFSDNQALLQIFSPVTRKIVAASIRLALTGPRHLCVVASRQSPMATVIASNASYTGHWTTMAGTQSGFKITSVVQLLPTFRRVKTVERIHSILQGIRFWCENIPLLLIYTQRSIQYYKDGHKTYQRTLLYIFKRAPFQDIHVTDYTSKVLIMLETVSCVHFHAFLITLATPRILSLKSQLSISSSDSQNKSVAFN